MNKLYLTDWFFLSFGLTQALGLFCLLIPSLFALYLTTTAGLVAIVVVDRLFVSQLNMQGDGEFPLNPELGKSIPLNLRLIPKSKFAGVLKVRIPSLPTLEFRQQLVSCIRHESSLGPRYHAQFFAHTKQLGYSEINHVQLFYQSQFKFWRRVRKLPIRSVAFRVFPKAREVSEQTFQETIKNQVCLYQGNRKLLRGNTADQFHSVRKYQSSDPIRHIDPKKSAKFNELMSRTYDSFFDHHLVIGLDTGRSMMGELSGSRKIDYCLSACYSLARHAQKSRDRVSFFSFSQKTHTSIKSSRHSHQFFPLFTGESLETHEEESNYEIVLANTARLSGQRSIFILFTDASRPSVQSSILPILPQLCHNHLCTIVSLIDSNYDLKNQIDQVNLPLNHSSYNRILYSCWLEEQLSLFRRKVNQFGGGLVCASELDWMGLVIRIYDRLRSSIRV